MPRLGRAALALGYAGLLPQVGVLVAAVIQRDSSWAWVGFAYASLILSFLGGIWWGFAMRRTAGRGPLLVLAVLPSLVPLPLVGIGISRFDFTLPLTVVGAVLMLTLPVDRRLEAMGDAPPGWMRLRVPLSLGLGLLSIAIAVVEG